MARAADRNWLHNNNTTIGTLVRFKKIVEIIEGVPKYEYDYCSDIPCKFNAIESSYSTSIVPWVTLRDVDTLKYSDNLANAFSTGITLILEEADIYKAGLPIKWVTFGTQIDIILFNAEYATYDDIRDVVEYFEAGSDIENALLVATGIIIGKKYTDSYVKFEIASKNWEKLYNPICTDIYTANTDANFGQARPFIWGFCKNISPVFVNGAGTFVSALGETYNYSGSVYQIQGQNTISTFDPIVTEVREDGNVLDPSQYSVVFPSSNSREQLLIITSGSPEGHGKITCDTEVNLVNSIIIVIRNLLVTALSPYGSGYIDYDSFLELSNRFFSDDMFKQVGIYETSADTTYISIIDTLLESAGCFLYLNAYGLISIAPKYGYEVYAQIMPDDELNENIYNISKEDLIKDVDFIDSQSIESVEIHYNKNFTPQAEENLAGILTQDEKAKYTKEYDISLWNPTISYPIVPSSESLAGMSIKNRVVEVSFSNVTAARTVIYRLYNAYSDKGRTRIKVSIPIDFRLRMGTIFALPIEYSGYHPIRKGVILSISHNLKNFTSTVEFET